MAQRPYITTAPDPPDAPTVEALADEIARRIRALQWRRMALAAWTVVWLGTQVALWVWYFHAPAFSLWAVACLIAVALSDLVVSRAAPASSGVPWPGGAPQDETWHVAEIAAGGDSRNDCSARQRPSPDIVRALVVLLRRRGSGMATRLAVLRALEHIGDATAIPAVRALAVADGSAAPFCRRGTAPGEARTLRTAAQRCLLALQIRSCDPQSVETLALAVRDGDRETAAVAGLALEHLLPRLTARDAPLVPPAATRALATLLRDLGSHPDLLVAILEAFEVIGDAGTTGAVRGVSRRYARRRPRDLLVGAGFPPLIDGAQRVRAAAGRCLAALEKRERLLRPAPRPSQTPAEQLLRPASRPDGDLLLRPASEPPSVPEEQLLGASSSDEAAVGGHP